MFSSCLYNAIGDVVKFPIKGSCNNNCNCLPFHREDPWKSYKFPSQKTIEGFNNIDQYQHNQQLIENNRKFTSQYNYYTNKPQPNYPTPNVTFKNKVHYDLHNKPLEHFDI